MAKREDAQQIIFQVHKETHQWFKSFCARRGVSMSSYLAGVIDDLKREEEERKIRLQQYKRA